MKRFFRNVLAVILGNLLTFSLVLLVFIGFLMFSAAGDMFKSKGPKQNSVLEITLDMPIKESSMENEFSIFAPTSGESIYFRNIIQSIENAKNDDRIEGISLKVSSFNGGSSQLSDIRDALIDFKESGKFIYSYSHNSDQAAYILNSTADSLFQNPMGMLFLQGLSGEVMFYKDFGDKYGIDFQVIRHGDYKSAVEPFMRNDLSEENREQMEFLLNGIWKEYSTEIAKLRGVSLEELNTSIDSLDAFNPEKALNAKLVDKLVHESDYQKALAKRLELDIKEDESVQKVLDKHTISLANYAGTLKPNTHKDRIAVLYASGVITSGDGFSGIQSEVYKNEIRKLAENDRIKAVVLRVNSPGGSADAAEEILYELKQLRQKKPIIVSFGDLAASGGYYIAMEADSIFTSPNTITGSIGVLGMVPNIQTLMNNHGITTDIVKTNENSDFLNGIFRPMTDKGMETMTEMTENVYKVFVNHVSNARDMTFEEVDAVGGGRVWTGAQALELGLVDALGTLDDAIEAAAAKAGLENYSISSHPYRKGGIEEILNDMSMVKSEQYIQQELGEEYFKIYKDLKFMKENKGILVRMPFDIKIK